MKTATKRTPRDRRGRPNKALNKEDKRQIILDAAEELFAQHGFYGVTLKQAAQKAGVDTALLHYYFDNKQGLFDAVFSRRAQTTNKIRMELLNQYEESAGDDMTVEGLLDVFVRPLFDAAINGGPGWRNYYALVAQVNNTPAWGGETMTRYFDPVIQRFIKALCRILPDASTEDVYWSFLMLSGSIMLALSQTGRIDRLSEGKCNSRDLQAAFARLLPYSAGGYLAVCGKGRGSLDTKVQNSNFDANGSSGG